MNPVWQLQTGLSTNTYTIPRLHFGHVIHLDRAEEAR
jgi:hypothetical protein